MLIRMFGITLRRMRLQDIELLREKRNLDEVQQFMEYRNYITPEMQLMWFNSIDNFYNFYYLIEYQGKTIGLLNDKKMDWQARTSESGLFLWDAEYLNTFVPVLASLVLLEVGFYYLNWNFSYIHVLRDNPQAIDYVKRIGYSICKNQEDAVNQKYYLTRELFETKGRKIRNVAKLFWDPESGNGYVILEKEDFENGLAQRIEQHFEQESIQLSREETTEGIKYYR